jgi:hypothetical protein
VIFISGNAGLGAVLNAIDELISPKASSRKKTDEIHTVGFRLCDISKALRCAYLTLRH